MLWVLRKRPEEVKANQRHQFIHRQRNRYTVKAMCRVLHVSESGYYGWLRNKDKPTKRLLLSAKIREIIAGHPNNDNYGVDRVHLALRQTGIDVSRRTVYRAMKECGLLHRRRVPHGITKATTEVQEQENVIKRDFTPINPCKSFSPTSPRCSAQMESFIFHPLWTASAVKSLPWKCAIT